MAALEELEQVYLKAKADPTFESELQGYLRH
jgi:tryptophan synthase beta subunit